MIRTYSLSSSPMPSGVSWLVNALLELDIRCDHGLDSEQWRMTPDHCFYLSENERIILKWHLPVLHEKHGFRFRDDVRVVWEHRLDFALRDDPIILFVRDPRDVVLSEYRRNYEDQLPLEEFLQLPLTWKYHVPGCFYLPAPETWAYFHLFWMAVRDIIPVHVVRFEDTRIDPERELRRVLGILGVSRSSEEVLRAVQSSSFDRAKEAMKRQMSETGQDNKSVGKGKVGDWKDVFDSSHLSSFSGPVHPIAVELGYERPGQPWRELSDVRPLLPAGIDRWFPMGWSVIVARLVQLLRDVNFGSDYTCAALLASALWTYRIFREDEIGSLKSWQVFQAFYSTNLRYQSVPAVARAVEYGSESFLRLAILGEVRDPADLSHYLFDPTII